MKFKLQFLAISSLVVKIVAWFVLVLGVISGIFISFGLAQSSIGYTPRWMGLVVFGVYAFFFVFSYLVAGTADLVVKLMKGFNKEDK